MLKFIRKKGVMKKILWCLAIVIILVFGFLGQAYLLNAPGEIRNAGQIFGRTVSLEEFEKQRQQTVVQAILRYGKNFNKIRDFLNIEAETWDRLILLQEARKRRITVSDADVIAAVQKYPFFQGEDGAFDSLRYNDVLKYALKIRPRDFEETVRDSLKFEKLYLLETSSTDVTEEEAFNAYRQENEKVQVSYAFIPAEEFKGQVSVDEAEVEKYYQDHKQEFFMPPAVNAEYVRAEYPADLKDEALAKAKDETLAKIRAVIQEAAEGKTLAETAKGQGLTVQESGFFSMEQPNLQMGQSFETLQNIFRMDPGQISDPIETPRGFQVIRLKEKKEAYVPEFADIKDTVAEAWKVQEAKQFAKQKAEESLTALTGALASTQFPDFAKTARDMKLDVQQTPFFSLGQYLPTIGIEKGFQETAFSLNDTKKISGIVEVLKGYCILYLDSRQPADMKGFEEKKQEIADALLTEKRNQVFSDFLTKLRLQANLKDNISEYLASRQSR
ncbi:MAG: peptidyl-prolyl cis-trans isomerase [Candidatus Omnitrophota bacterium]|nr:peptidyl-prolyl cis-trans isomerase [Candidatus Omnitrophota bacterium]